MKRKRTSASILKERRARVIALIAVLQKLFPSAGMILRYGTPWELVVAVQLSAQCTDAKVNQITEQLFKKYRTLDAYVAADPAEFAQDIRSSGYFNAKTKNILGAAKMLKEHFGGVVPGTMDELVRLPGVARKTANVVLGNAFGVVEGIAVDTHVHRFAVRFNLTDHPNDVKKIEEDLMEIIPRRDWFRFTYLVIEYGRKIAPARAYDVMKDPLIAIYPPAAKVFKKRNLEQKSRAYSPAR
jgi:endonuclease-3